MFDILFGWPKASKCKKTIKRARRRLRLLKNKRHAMARQLRDDLAELVQNGHEEIAVKKVEQLIQDESIVGAYELLDHFCEFILKKLSFIRRHKDCPDDINEAVSSLIFASARCGDLPELYVIRKLFGQRYGEKFEIAAVELFSGNLVNQQLKENLSVMSVPDDVKYRMVDEIARDNSLQPEVEEYKGYQFVESDVQISDTTSGSKIQPSEDEEIERDVICVNSSISNASDTFSLPESSCLTHSSALYLSYPLQKKEKKVEDFTEQIPFATSDLQNRREVMALVSSLEILSLPPCAEAIVDHVDNIEGCQFSFSEYDSCQDRIQFGCDESDVDQDESTSEKSYIRSSKKSRRAPKKRSRRRSVLFENQCLMDIGYMMYYHRSCRSPSTHKYGYSQKRLKQHSFPEKEKGLHFCQFQGSTKQKSLNLDMCDCSLVQPCYCCVYYDQDCLEALPMKLKRGIIVGCEPLWHDESNKGMELATIPHEPNGASSYTSGAFGDHLLTYPDYHSGKPNTEIKLETPLVSYAFSNVSNPSTSGSSARTEIAAHYSKALTVPSEWPKNREDKILRTYSYSPKQPKHVHPKLPEYEDIYAKFTALKRDRLEYKDSSEERRLE